MIKYFKILAFASLLSFIGCDKAIIVPQMPENTKPGWEYPRKDCRNSGYIAGRLSNKLEVKWHIELPALDPTSPVVFADKVIVGLPNKRIVAYDAKTGNKVGDIWVDVPLCEPPVIFDDKMWFIGFGAYNRVGVYDFTNGKTKWTKSCGDAQIWGIPTDSIFIIATLSGGIYGLSTVDGKKRWSQKRKLAIRTAIAYRTGAFFAASGGEICRIDNDGKIVYRKKLGNSLSGASIISDDKIFAHSADGNIYALSLENGEIIWRDSIPDECGLPMATDGKNLIVADKMGKIFAFDCGTGAKKWVSKLGDVINAPPIIVGNDVIAVSYTGKLFKIDVETGSIEYSLSLNKFVSKSPVSDGEKIFIATANGELFCIR
ncbi:PQQ-binding-like beta-propeller repeat protein [bacterium]|nr:PQQ-binding-like beta-propeller repeat protein [bacterium]